MNLDVLIRNSKGADVSATPNGYRLTIPAGDRGRYHLAQLDDYANLPRKAFPLQPPLTLGLRARVSAASIPGTWGFGLWNDPFGLSLGYGGKPWRLPALPNAVWFFHASEENHLTFRNDKPASGFLAQAFSAPRFHPRLAAAGLAFPFSRKTARRLMSHVVNEDGERLSVDVTQWHAYRLEWNPHRSAFWVDEVLVLETSVSPRPPLGLVIWVDNQFAAWGPEGQLGFGVLATKEAWLEVKELEVKRP